MDTSNLTTTYLAKLSNAEHDGITAQINQRLTDFTTDNPLLATAITALQQARQAEDAAFNHFSGKDFVSDDLKKEDRLEDQYMSTIHNILLALMLLPDTEPLKRQAEIAERPFKDFKFSTSAGFEPEARNVLNMVQEWKKADKYDLDALGIKTWVDKANEQANKVLQLIVARVDNKSAKVKGELADARKATDAAIRKAFDVLNALAVLQSSAELTQLLTALKSIEELAKQYYLTNGKKQ